MNISRVLAPHSLIGVAVMLLPCQGIAQDTDWSGPFVGAGIGIGMIESEIHDFDEQTAFGYSKNDGPAAVANLQAGYNWQNGNFVYGAVVSLGAANFDAAFETDFCGPSTHETVVNAHASIRGRAGVATGNTLFYGTAGVASIDTEERLACDDEDTFEVNDRYEALVIGFGVESMITDSFSVNAEYLSYMADDQIDEEDGGGESSTFDIRADTVSVGVNYHFF